MKFRVLIHVDSLRRDSAACITLAEILRSRGIDTLVSGQQSTAHYLKYWRPHLLLHTSATKVVNYEILGVISSDDRPLVHLVPQEGRSTSSDTISASYMALQAAGYHLIDQIYVWNKVHFDWLMEHSPLPPERVRVVGGFRLDLAKYGTAPDLEARPPVVGFISRFSALNPHDGDYGLHFFAQTHAQLEHKLPKLSVQIQACLIFSYLITTLIEHHDFTVSIRPHHNEYPNANFYTWAKRRFGDRILVDNSFSFYEWASTKLALVSTTSSTFVEVYIARTPLVCIDRLIESELSRWYNPGTLDIYDTFQDDNLPQSTDDFFAILNRLRQNFKPAPAVIPASDLIKEQYMWPYEGSSLRAIADGICDALNTLGDRCRRVRPRLPRLSGDIAYAIGMAKWFRAGQLGPKLQYVYNDHLHGRDVFFKQVAARIEQDKAYQYVEEQISESGK